MLFHLFEEMWIKSLSVGELLLVPFGTDHSGRTFEDRVVAVS